jgi:hypothetical protein
MATAARFRLVRHPFQALAEHVPVRIWIPTRRWIGEPPTIRQRLIGGPVAIAAAAAVAQARRRPLAFRFCAQPSFRTGFFPANEQR